MSHEAAQLKVEVVEVSRVGDVALIELAPYGGGELPAWRAGAHIDLRLPGDVVRQYSLCGPAGADRWRVGVLREVDGRGGSQWLVDHAEPGLVLGASQPRRHFAYEPSGATTVFLAGGIGVTPIAAMAAEAKAAGADYSVAYSGRTRASMALADELLEVHGERVALYVGDEGTRADLDAIMVAAGSGAVAYACGPAAYLDAAAAAASRHGVDLRVEHFTPVELAQPARDEAFEVELAMTGVTVEVQPGTSILQAVEEAGALVLSSCTEGTCGTCETPVLEGEVDHRDSILTPDERARNDVMYVCVSRAACPRLVLDL
ncbi:PDR/VanB family oxidoreductase [Demequina sp. NBRC 110055]|uniref:PDR/VanB family oxidoreductase n=1 Tax=Demequina sp. NBRC 110055 TaxID=1570344 RepID=UPI000A028BD7|nr:PDR/VanB family oxidoreductase [Demequina sp. NBRC 110055]